MVALWWRSSLGFLSAEFDRILLIVIELGRWGRCPLRFAGYTGLGVDGVALVESQVAPFKSTTG